MTVEGSFFTAVAVAERCARDFRLFTVVGDMVDDLLVAWRTQIRGKLELEAVWDN